MMDRGLVNLEWKRRGAPLNRAHIRKVCICVGYRKRLIFFTMKIKDDLTYDQSIGQVLQEKYEIYAVHAPTRAPLPQEALQRPAR